jgi:prophage antirepressor-like protein
MKLLEFNFNSYSIRTILIDDEPWFVLKDIGAVLELSNHKQALIDLKKRLKKGGVSYEVSRTYPIVDSMGREQEIRIVSESGLYELVFASRKDIAIKFRYWVTSEVLPSIRKTGSYSISESIEEPKDFSTTVGKVLQKSKVAFELIEFITEKKEYQLFLLDRLLQEDSPLKLLNFDFSNSFFIPTELGKMVGKSAVEINRVLEFKGLQTKNSGIWTLTETGKEFGIEVNGQFPQLKWRIEAVL